MDEGEWTAMKCLLISDLHYALKQFDWIANVAKDFDVVVIAGDHLDISSAVEARVQITVILTYLKRLQDKTRLIVSSGNHDLDARNTDGEKFAKWLSRVRGFGVQTDGDCLTVDGTLFTICPWWDGPQTREQVGAQLARSTTRRRTSRLRVGADKSTSAMPTWCAGFGSISPTLCSPATSISRPSARAVPG
jgi:hypothetical protein